MDRTTSLLAGLFGAFAVSTYLMVLAPQAQLGGLEPHYTEEEGKFSDIYPIQNGAADQGRAVYISEGCIYCHSQQVRDAHTGTDMLRGWGKRRTVARDYLYETPALLGSSRLGPDLANVGNGEWRNEDKGDTRKPAKRDAAWQYLHLYAPKTIITESNHPPYTYLFEKRKVSGQPSGDALNLSDAYKVEEGYEVVPKPAARALVAYLQTLDHSFELAEAKAPAPAGAPAAAAAPAK